MASVLKPNQTLQRVTEVVPTALRPEPAQIEEISCAERAEIGGDRRGVTETGGARKASTRGIEETRWSRDLERQMGGEDISELKKTDSHHAQIHRLCFFFFNPLFSMFFLHEEEIVS